MKKHKKRAIFILDSSYESLKKKGVSHLIKNRNENGYFEKVWTLHPFCKSGRSIPITPCNVVIELKTNTVVTLRVLSWILFGWHIGFVILYLCYLIHKNKIDIVRAHDPFFCGFIGYIAAKITRRPFVVSVHSDYEKISKLDADGGMPKLFGSTRNAFILADYIFSHADKVLAISRYIGRFAETHGAPAKNIRIFRHAIEIDKFCKVTPAIQRNKPRHKTVIAVVSRLSPQKHISDVILVAALIRNKFKNFSFEIAGEGPARAELETMIKEKDLEQHVSLLGNQSEQEIILLLERSDIFFVPLGGASLVEGAAAGLPTVAYDWEWQSELIQSGKTGILVPENDIKNAAKHLIFLMSNRQYAQKLGNSLKKLTEDLYHPETINRARQSVYSELLENTLADSITTYTAQEDSFSP